MFLSLKYFPIHSKIILKEVENCPKLHFFGKKLSRLAFFWEKLQNYTFSFLGWNVSKFWQNINLWCCLKFLSLFFRTLFFTWCAFMLWVGAIFKCMLLPSFGDSPQLINVLNFPVFLDPFPYGINRFFLENGETNCIPQLIWNRITHQKNLTFSLRLGSESTRDLHNCIANFIRQILVFKTRTSM